MGWQKLVMLLVNIVCVRLYRVVELVGGGSVINGATPSSFEAVHEFV